MADQSDVETALVDMVSSALYPEGPYSPSVDGTDCRIYRGWPNSAALDADLAAGIVNVTVFPAGGPDQTSTRFTEEWLGAPGRPALTARVSGSTVAFDGTAEAGQVAGVLIDGCSYAYRVQPGDTPPLVAASLAGLARAKWIVQLSHNQLTIPGASSVIARVVADAAMRKEVRRQQQEFRITCWCPTPASRDTMAAAIDRAMSNLHFLTLADGSKGRLQYVSTTVFDQSQNARLYRRDLNYCVEFATIDTAVCPSMLFGALVLNSKTITV